MFSMKHSMHWTVLIHFNILFASCSNWVSLTEKTCANIPTASWSYVLHHHRSPVVFSDLMPRGSSRCEEMTPMCLWRVTNNTMKCEIILWSVCWEFIVWYTGFKESISSSSLQAPLPLPSPLLMTVPWGSNFLVKAIQIYDQTYNSAIVKRLN